MFNLKKLHCSQCYNLRDKNLINLLKCATDLRILDIYDCKKTANSVINTAIQVTKID